jgi:alanine racemase
VHRSELTIDLGALRRNIARLKEALGGAELWAVLKANAYGHGATDVARVALDEGAAALCTATLGEAVELRAAIPEARILVMGPLIASEIAQAAEARLEVTAPEGRIPEGLPVHIKLDTGMGRFGTSELPAPTRNVVGLMSHLGTVDRDLEFARRQVARFRELTDGAHGLDRLTRHMANSGAALRLPEAHFDAGRCGVALYGLSPFGEDPAVDGLEPVLKWTSRLAQVKHLQPGESTGYARRFIAEEPTWIGLVPVGYGDGFLRAYSGTSVLVDGEPRPVIGNVSMDSFAVALGRELPVGTAVTLLGKALRAEHHAAHAGTINYEITTLITSDSRRARRTVLDA